MKKINLGKAITQRLDLGLGSLGKARKHWKGSDRGLNKKNNNIGTEHKKLVII